jgi:hypothetical protein
MDKQTKIALRLLFQKTFGCIPDQVSFLNETDDSTTKHKFIPPTLLEVVFELKHQGVRNARDCAEKFWNFYESKGWMVGKNKMKNWKAAIKTWNFEKDNLIL